MGALPGCCQDVHWYKLGSFWAVSLVLCPVIKTPAPAESHSPLADCVVCWPGSLDFTTVGHASPTSNCQHLKAFSACQFLPCAQAGKAGRAGEILSFPAGSPPVNNASFQINTQVPLFFGWDTICFGAKTNSFFLLVFFLESAHYRGGPWVA